jgi:hypothetical protein
MKTYGEWRYSSTILDLAAIWKWVVSFTPLSLYPQENPPPPQYSLDRSLGGPENRPGRYGEEKNLMHLSGIEGRPSRPLPVAIPTELFKNKFPKIISLGSTQTREFTAFRPQTVHLNFFNQLALRVAARRGYLCMSSAVLRGAGHTQIHHPEDIQMIQQRLKTNGHCGAFIARTRPAQPSNQCLVIMYWNSMRLESLKRIIKFYLIWKFVKTEW